MITGNIALIVGSLMSSLINIFLKTITMNQRSAWYFVLWVRYLFTMKPG